MECSSCHKENSEGAHFCIFCGYPVQTTEGEQPPAPEQGLSDAIPPEVQALRDELRGLTRNLWLMGDRLAALERLQGVPATPAQQVSIPPSRQAAPGLPTEAPAPPGVTPPPQGGDIFDRMREWDWEQIWGGNWLARIGVVALVIGVAFFLKLAFDNDWIGETGRIVLGILAGLAMLGGGEYWQRRYPTYAQAFSGGGIALLYLAIFAAFGIYDLIGLYPATAFLLLLSVASAALALRYNSPALAIIGIFGAFSAPFILGAFSSDARETSQAARSNQLLVYIIVVAVGVLALSTFRNWRWFTLLGLIGSLSAFGAWHGWYGAEASLLTSQGSLTLIFLIFVGATTLFHVLWRRAPESWDQSLMVLNAVFYFGISYGLLWEDFRAWLGGFTILLALFYGGIAYLAVRRSAENVRLSFLALGIALVFLTIAIPVQLGDRAWTSIAWAAEGLVLLWLSFTLRMPTLRIFSYAAFLLVIGRLFFFDTPVETRMFQVVLNERVLAFLVSIAAMYIAAYLLRREDEALQPWEQWTTGQAQAGFPFYAAFLVAANFFSIWVLTAELISAFDHSLIGRSGSDAEGLRDAKNLSTTAVWAAYAVALLVVGIAKGSRPVRLAALGLLAIPIAKVFVYDVFTLERAYRVAAFVGLGVLLLASGYLYQRYGKAIKGFLLER